MAEEALRSTSLKANFHRLTRLLMRGGVNLLRETFDFIHSPADLPLRLADPAIQVQLRGARLTQPERACLYPSPGMYGKSNDFDITLIFKLLRTICNLTPPPGPRGWDDLPNSSDHTLVADLVRIKYYRNEIHGHCHSMEISDTEFVRLWEEISEALLRIAANISPAKRDEWKKSIDDLLCKPLTPNEEICIEELKTWYMQDLEVKNEVVKLREDMGSLRDTTAAVLVILLNVLGHNQAAGSELLLPVPEQAERADDPEANNPLLPEPEQAAGADDPEPNNPPDIDVWDVILSFKESADLFLRYLSSKLHLLVRNKGKGSWHITVECSSSRVLEGLWEDYRSGHLNSVAQEMLITPQVLEKLGRTELKLKTFISKDQYEKGKKLLKASSGAEDESETQSAFQATITKAFSEGSIEPDLPARISTLERENVELKEKVKAIQGNFQSERDLLGRISTLERENVELKEKVKAIQGIFESKIDLQARISTLERENVKVEEKVKAAIERIFQSEIVSKVEREAMDLLMERENIESGRSKGAKEESRRPKVSSSNESDEPVASRSTIFRKFQGFFGSSKSTRQGRRLFRKTQKEHKVNTEASPGMQLSAGPSREDETTTHVQEHDKITDSPEISGSDEVESGSTASSGRCKAGPSLVKNIDSGKWHDKVMDSQKGLESDGEKQSRGCITTQRAYHRTDDDYIHFCRQERTRVYHDPSQCTGQLSPSRPAQSLPLLPYEMDIRDLPNSGIKIEQQPKSKKQPEGSEVIFELKVQEQDKYSYQWLKDGAELKGKCDAILILDNVELREFGWYKCRVCSRENFRINCESSRAWLDVVPKVQKGTRLKMFIEVDLSTCDRIAFYLDKDVPYGLGGNRQAAAVFGMTKETIGAFAVSKSPGQVIVEFVKATTPDITVYEVSKKFKGDEMKRFDIAKILENHLTITEIEF